MYEFPLSPGVVIAFLSRSTNNSIRSDDWIYTEFIIKYIVVGI